MHETIWQFQTKNFTVRMLAEPENDLDLSFDDTGEVREKLESGEYVAFVAHCVVECRGAEVGDDYLGGCIYRSVSEFRDHVGIRQKSREDGANYGSYFSDMVREAIREARLAIAGMPRLRVPA